MYEFQYVRNQLYREKLKGVGDVSQGATLLENYWSRQGVNKC
jgi:hypothetical protein